ncbi:MAG: heparinase II/III family protein [Phycisphaerales bacterium]|nr:heparinase II/III family protein [Phycisphaerales bacterium]MCB9857940.1 heparinase II/III family protein [Phycisphaerales bacterium]
MLRLRGIWILLIGLAAAAICASAAPAADPPVGGLRTGALEKLSSDRGRLVAGPVARSQHSIKAIDAATLRRQMIARPFTPYLSLLKYSGVDGSVDRVVKSMREGWQPKGERVVSLTPPVDWSAFRDSNRSLNYQLHCWDPLVPLVAAVSKSHDAEVLRFSLAVALDWIAQHPLPSNPTRDGSGSFAWYDMAVGLRITRLATLFDAACRDSTVSDETIVLLWRSLVDHFIYLENDKLIAFHSNHGIFQAAGQLAAARLFSWQPEIHAAVRQAEQRLQQMFRAHFTDEGVHREHSPGYQLAVMRTFSNLHRAGLLSCIAGFDEEFLKMQNAFAWMVQPDGYLLNFGDTDQVTLTSAELDEEGWTSASLRFAVTEGRQGTAPVQKTCGFKASGFVALRSDWPAPPDNAVNASYLAMQCAFHSRAHKHADDLSIAWFDHGQTILCDAGRYGYLGKSAAGSELRRDGFFYSDPNRVFVESTRAHCTVQVDDKNHRRIGVEPFGSALRSWGEQEGIQFAIGSVIYDKSVHHRRLVVTRPHEWLLVVDDIADDGGAPHDIRQWFQMGPEVKFEATRGQSVGFRLANRNQQLWAVPLESAMTLTPPVRGQTEPRLQGWWSPSALKMEPIWSLNWRAEGSNVRVAALFAFGDQMPAPIDPDTRAERDVISYGWRRGDRVERVLVDLRHAEPEVTHSSTQMPATSRPAD